MKSDVLKATCMKMAEDLKASTTTTTLKMKAARPSATPGSIRQSPIFRVLIDIGVLGPESQFL